MLSFVTSFYVIPIFIPGVYVVHKVKVLFILRIV